MLDLHAPERHCGQLVGHWSTTGAFQCAVTRAWFPEDLFAPLSSLLTWSTSVDHRRPFWIWLLREFRNLHMVGLQQASGGVINRRNGDLISDLGLQ